MFMSLCGECSARCAVSLSHLLSLKGSAITLTIDHSDGRTSFTATRLSLTAYFDFCSIDYQAEDLPGDPPIVVHPLLTASSLLYHS